MAIIQTDLLVVALELQCEMINNFSGHMICFKRKYASRGYGHLKFEPDKLKLVEFTFLSDLENVQPKGFH